MSLTTAVSNITLVVLFKPYLITWPVEHSAKNTTIYIIIYVEASVFIFYVHYLVCDISHLQVYTSYKFL